MALHRRPRRTEDMTIEQRLQPSPGSAAVPDKPKLDLSLTQVLGGAFAAMTAAYLGSQLSVAGTVVGAAVASIVAAVAGSVYTASLRTTQNRVKTVFRGRVGSTLVPTTVESTPSWDVPTSTGAPARPNAPAPVLSRRPRLQWKAVALSALGAFLLAAVALTGLEIATGSSLSGEQGTTVTQVTEPQRPVTQDDPSPSASPSSAAPSSASPSPASPAPSAAPTASGTPSTEASPSVDNTPAPAPVPSEAEPSAISPTPSPSATAESPTPSAGG